MCCSTCREVLVGFQTIGLDGSDQAVAGCAGPGAARGITKQPITSTDGKGPYVVFRQCIADVQTVILAIADQQIPLVQCIVDCLPGQAVFRHPSAVGLR